MRYFVTAKPLSGEEVVKQIDKTHFVVSVKEPPVKGRANIAIVKVFSKYLKVPPSNVQIISGYASRRKIIAVD